MYGPLTLSLILLGTFIFNLWFNNWKKTQQLKQDSLQAKLDVLKVMTHHECFKSMQGEPASFEKWTANLLKLLGYKQVELTPTVNDGVKDIICLDANDDKVFVVCKLWSPDQKANIGRPEVQKLVGAMVGSRIKKGLFITTTDFTPEAKAYLQALPEEYTIEAIDGNTLTQKLYDLRTVNLEPLFAV